MNFFVMATKICNQFFVRIDNCLFRFDCLNFYYYREIDMMLNDKLGGRCVTETEQINDFDV